MKVELIVGLLLVVALAYAWYTERTKRRQAELDAEVLKRKAPLEPIKQKLDENKEEYDDAQLELFGNPIPAHMLDDIGKSAKVVKPINSNLPSGGRELGARIPRGFRPGLDGPTPNRGNSDSTEGEV